MADSTGPFDIGTVVARLDSGSQLLKGVQGAAELATALQAGAPQTPMAYVLLAHETSDDTYGSSELHRQTVHVLINVAFAVRNYRTADLGAQVKDDLRSVVAEARELLLGWMPTQVPDINCSGFDLKGGKLESYTNATVWWVEAYQLTYFIEVTPQ